MANSNRNKRAFTLYTVLMVLLFGFIALFIVKKLNYTDVQYLGNYAQNMFVPDALTGYAASANTVINSTKKVENDTIYSVKYTIGDNGLRVTPSNGDANEHFVFFGCSFTFGEGLDDSSSLPFLFAEDLPPENTIQVYNMALQGYGPQQMLRLLGSERVSKLVDEPTGNAVYVLLPEHIYRATGAPYVMYSWGASMPCYQKEGNELAYKGSFADARPIGNLWYKALGFAGILQLPFIGYPAITDDDIELTATIIQTSKQKYVAQFPGARFRVVCYPSAWLNSEYQKLTKELEARDIELIDLRGQFTADSTFTIPGDGHPNRLVNTVVARILADRP